jgi:hypothetical protein
MKRAKRVRIDHRRYDQRGNSGSLRTIQLAVTRCLVLMDAD